MGRPPGRFAQLPRRRKQTRWTALPSRAGLPRNKLALEHLAFTDGAEQRDPAAYSPIEVPDHGFSAAAAPFSATRRRRHAWVAVTKLVTPIPTTMNSTSRNGSPIT